MEQITEKIKSLRLCSYNCNSFRNNIETIRSLLESHDVLLLQELMLLKEDSHLVSNISDKWDCVLYIEDTNNDGIMEGRPKKGVSILWRKEISGYIKPVYHNDSIIGITLNFEKNIILLLNVYLPCYKKDNVSTVEFICTLAEIEAIIKDTKHNSRILMGDFNTNLDDSCFGKILRDFINNNNLIVADKVLPEDNFTYLSPGHNTTSWLDHVICSQDLQIDISDFSILYELCLMDHFPLSCVLNLNTKSCYNLHEIKINNFVYWNKLSKNDFNEYKSNIDFLCNSSCFVNHSLIFCNNYNCKNVNHLIGLDNFYEFLCNMLHISSKKFTVGNKKLKKCIPDWNNSIKPFFQEARDKFIIWKLNGREKEGNRLDEMKRTRAKFKYELKKSRANENEIRDKKLVDSFKNKNMKSFWHQIGNKNNKLNCATVIENETDEKKIAEQFAKKYKEVLNDKFCQSGEAVRTKEVNWLEVYNLFSIKEIKEILQNMKPSMGPDDVHLFHIKFGTEELYKMITRFLNGCLMHNHVPLKMLNGTIVPIIKNQFGNLNDIDNYRPVMMSSIFLKIPEYGIFNRIKDYVIINDRQHGFRPKYSTTTAAVTLKETVASYINRGSMVHAAFLDLTKAFDKVNHKILFKKLIDINVPNFLVNIIVGIYENQSACIKYKDGFSEFWKIGNGVRQGGILSPLLFCVYINELVDKISECKVGTKFGLYVSNIIMYADDLVLLSPSIAGLQILLNNAEKIITRLCLRINYEKSVTMNFCKKNCNFREIECKFVLPNGILKHVNETKYLGFIINRYLEEKPDIERARNKFFSKFNVILRRFNSLSWEVLLYLIKSYCTPFYGADLWINLDNSSQILNQFAIGYHKAFKKICNVSSRMSNHFICNQIGIFMFKHYINYLKICTAFRLLFKPCIFIEKNKAAFLKGELVRDIERIFNCVYGVSEIFQNDLDALKARIFYVQAREDPLR